MKLIITESQYKKLTEGEYNDFESFLTSKFPNISNLEIERGRHPIQGVYRKYIDPEKKTQFFKVLLHSSPKWEPGAGLVDTYSGTRLILLPKVYTYIKKYGRGFEYEFINWFNKRYNENVDIIYKSI